MIWVADAIANALRFIHNVVVRLRARRPVRAVVVELAGPYPERTPARRPWPQRMLRAAWQPQVESLEALRRRLERIGHAGTIHTVVVRVDELRAGAATVQSLRDALADLRARGKRVLIYLTEADLLTYHLATAADEIVMPPAAFWNVTGLRAEVAFLRTALDRAGLHPEFERIAEYKTAADGFMRSAMSEAHREMLDAILDGALDEVVGEIAAARELDRHAVRQAIDQAPLSVEDALGSGLIDAVAYEDELPGRVARPGDPPELLPWDRAQRRLHAPYRWRRRVAFVGVVEVVGAIVTGESRQAPLPVPMLGGTLAGSATVARALRAAERHPLLRAIVFHVDSRGGSALASDLIWREVERVKAKKPVVVYMGNVAGSGGYYVACGAHAIVAQPLTLTGSIGVVGGKITAQRLLTRLGIHHEIVARGAAATMPSAVAAYTPDQLERVQREMRLIYQRFVGVVAAGRRRDPAEIEAAARGRVWSGRQAQARGLVDELGSFPRALRRAAALAGVPEDQAVEAVTIRAPRSMPVPAAGSVAAALAETWLAIERLAEDGAVLVMDDVRLRS